MPDADVVGAGPNGLAAAVVLARADRSMRALEAGKTIGGGSWSAELTLPGFVHDVCSAVHPHPLASPSAMRGSGWRSATRDVDALVSLLGGDLSTPYQFIRVAEAVRELGLDGEPLASTKRGIGQTSGQVAELYDLDCDLHARRQESLEVLAPRPAHHERMPSLSTYRALRTTADPHDAWPLEQDAARATLQRADPRGFVDALLRDGEIDLAWCAAAAVPPDALGADVWLRLAGSSERDRPADALAVYQRIADEALERADRRAYRSAARILKRAQTAAQGRRGRSTPAVRTSRGCASSTGDGRP